MRTTLATYCWKNAVNAVVAISATALSASLLYGTDATFQVGTVLQELQLDDPVQGSTESSVTAPWWTDHMQSSMTGASRSLPASLDSLVQLAVQYSANLSVARHVPEIRETAVTEADAVFDWSHFVESLWDDTSEPVGSSLTVGGTARRFRDHTFRVDGGIRRQTTTGGSLELYQRFGHQNNNSTFFIPNDQGTSRLVLGFTQPLLRGRGRAYNTSLILLAQIDVATSRDEVQRQLQTHLLEVSRAYWTLYLERAALAQKVKLFLKTKEITEQLTGRQAIDTQRSQLVSAQAALEVRRTDLIRSQAAVKNAETRIRALINSPEFVTEAEQMELIPQDHPTTIYLPVDLVTEFSTAVRHRPEIAAAIKEIRAACIRRQMAANEVLPMLNLVTKTYVAGLRGESDIGGAWLDQFSTGEPSYSIGLQYEVPFQRRAANARLRRRQLEMSQLKEEYRAALELVRAEVEVAVREVATAYQELHAKRRALDAAVLEAETMEIRWKSLPNPDNTSSLLLESLLRSQERVTENEFSLAQAQLTYNLALINVKKTDGTLLRFEDSVLPTMSPTPTLVSEIQGAGVPDSLVGVSDVSTDEPAHAIP